MRTIDIHSESWPTKGTFRIARGERTHVDVVTLSIRDAEHTGRGECVPYARYDETSVDVVSHIKRISAALAHGLTRTELLATLPPGAARNAIDCALWDLECKQSRSSVYDLIGTQLPAPLITAYTLSIDAAKAMREAASRESHRPLLKIKLGGQDAAHDDTRLKAVRAGAPDARLIIDANEGWTFDQLKEFAPVAADLGVELIEQPLHADQDDALIEYDTPVLLGADESFRADGDVHGLTAKYGALNIKLDKTGGLTQALQTVKAAQEVGVKIMIGCMVSTSLSMAPALVLAGQADYIDLDGPLLLDKDREPGLIYEGSQITVPKTDFWGQP